MTDDEDMTPGQRAGLLRGRIASKAKAIEAREAEIRELQIEIIHLHSEVLRLDMERLGNPMSGPTATI